MPKCSKIEDFRVDLLIGLKFQKIPVILISTGSLYDGGGGGGSAK